MATPIHVEFYRTHPTAYDHPYGCAWQYAYTVKVGADSGSDEPSKLQRALEQIAGA